MSCWVVPTIAAEIWGVPVDSIWGRIRDGSLAHRVDEGFTFVDIDPPALKVQHPPTFTVLSAAEVEALEAERVGREVPPAPQPGPKSAVEADGDQDDAAESQSPDDDEASADLGDWRAARQRVARTRIPPGRTAKPRAA